MLVSAYVLYLAYGLIKDYEMATNPILSLAAIIIFVIGGGLILAHSAYKLITKDYDDGSGDDMAQPNVEGAGKELPQTECIEEEMLVTDESEQRTDEDRI